MNKINSWLNEESKLFSFLASEKITRKAGLTMHAITMLGFICVGCVKEHLAIAFLLAFVIGYLVHLLNKFDK
jgi:hypothetical protein